jgi:hypothetical protein
MGRLGDYGYAGRRATGPNIDSQGDVDGWTKIWDVDRVSPDGGSSSLIDREGVQPAQKTTARDNSNSDGGDSIRPRSCDPAKESPTTARSFEHSSNVSD